MVSIRNLIYYTQLGITNNCNAAQITITHMSPCQSLTGYSLLKWDIFLALTAQELHSLINSKASCIGNCSLLYNLPMDCTENNASSSSYIVAYVQVATMM
jgi:hypothetical protein